MISGYRDIPVCTNVASKGFLVSHIMPMVRPSDKTHYFNDNAFYCSFNVLSTCFLLGRGVVATKLTMHPVN